VAGGTSPLMNELANCCIQLIHSAKIKLFGYRIDLPELKPNVNLYIKLNTSKSQVNRYLENVLYRVVEGNLKIQNNTTA
jgi:hypothetical protein